MITVQPPMLPPLSALERLGYTLLGLGLHVYYAWHCVWAFAVAKGEPLMRICCCCRDEAEGSWQPFGPAPAPTDLPAFPRPGFHTRGFPLLPMCSTCRDLLRDGARVHFRWLEQWWHCEGGVLEREDAP